MLDEANSNLDAAGDEALAQAIEGVKKRGGIVVMVTHRLSEARSMSTYTVMLEAGRVIEAGPTPQLLAAPASERTRAYIAIGQ